MSLAGTVYPTTLPVVDLDNPAARLLLLLQEFQQRSAPNVSITSAWAGTLGVNKNQVVMVMPDVAVILSDLRRVVARLDNAGAQGMLDHFGREWTRAVFTPDHSGGQSSEGLVTAAGLAALTGLASLLSTLAGEGTTPDEEERADLATALREAIEEATTDTSVPLEVRTLLVSRLHDMLWALDHLRTVGPDGVKAAAERLAGAVATWPVPADRKRPMVGKVLRLAGRAWTLFTVGGDGPASIDGWTDILGQIGAG
jgi:hypothetical protein